MGRYNEYNTQSVKSVFKAQYVYGVRRLVLLSFVDRQHTLPGTHVCYTRFDGDNFWNSIWLIFKHSKINGILREGMPFVECEEMLIFGRVEIVIIINKRSKA